HTGHQLNFIVDLKAKWLGSKCYFISVYRSAEPHVKPSTFETKFARLEYVGNGKFKLSFMRHTGKWIELYALTRLGGGLWATAGAWLSFGFDAAYRLPFQRLKA